MASPPPPRRKLGRGLGTLLQAQPVAIDSTPSVDKYTQNTNIASDGQPLTIDLDAIVPSPFQPRRVFDETEISRLAASLAQDGMLQPVVVRILAGGATYELIAGERRWRAARVAGMARIPAIVKDVDDNTAAALALVENLQRKDLHPIERAEALRSLQQRCGLTQQQVADRVGLDRATVANLIRLLDLEPEILDMISSGTLTPGHGKALLSCDAGERRIALAKAAVAQSWSVRAVESRASQKPTEHGPKASVSLESSQKANPDILRLERQLSEHLGSRVSLSIRNGGDSGEVRIAFYSLEHFDGVLAKIGFRPDDL